MKTNTTSARRSDGHVKRKAFKPGMPQLLHQLQTNIKSVMKVNTPKIKTQAEFAARLHDSAKVFAKVEYDQHGN